MAMPGRQWRSCCSVAVELQVSGGNGNGTGELVDRRVGRAQVMADRARVSTARGSVSRRPAMSVTHAVFIV